MTLTELTKIVFDFLSQLGFTHPLHPAMTHIPMGMVMGAVTFRFVGLIRKFRILARTGFHCIILGLLGIFPTVFTGYLDWQHTFGGEWEFLIVLKMVLAALLLIVLAVIAFKDDPDQPKLNKMTLLYLLTVLVAIGLGFSGGELQYG